MSVVDQADPIALLLVIIVALCVAFAAGGVAWWALDRWFARQDRRRQARIDAEIEANWDTYLESLARFGSRGERTVAEDCLESRRNLRRLQRAADWVADHSTEPRAS